MYFIIILNLSGFFKFGFNIICTIYLDELTKGTSKLKLFIIDITKITPIVENSTIYKTETVASER